MSDESTYPSAALREGGGANCMAPELGPDAMADEWLIMGCSAPTGLNVAAIAAARCAASETMNGGCTTDCTVGGGGASGAEAADDTGAEEEEAFKARAALTRAAAARAAAVAAATAAASAGLEDGGEIVAGVAGKSRGGGIDCASDEG